MLSQNSAQLTQSLDLDLQKIFLNVQRIEI